MADLVRDGWATFPTDPALLEWVAAALPRARDAVADPVQRATGLVCEGTWFVGVDALDNDSDGRVGDVPLRGAARAAAEALFGALPLHRAQVSVIWPGYPRPRDGESEAAFRFRQRRDGAHLDGLLPEGPDRRRFFREPHAWILGLPLTACGPGASPLVVWRGSHHILRRALLRACDGHAPETWSDLDLTEVYTAARAEIFATCERVELHAQPGQAYLLHRLVLHGVAPWQEGAEAPPDGRMVAYFRPLLPGGAARSLTET
ncbi:MAG: hypothetical protein LPK02_05575 [Rhodobacterales bacterium]|nr:hypothetical protein [Rhodobacterales bacterium]MDX5412495.1 hypothetical protein [Rhodobacterales bacterium]